MKKRLISMLMLILLLNCTATIVQAAQSNTNSQTEEKGDAITTEEIQQGNTPTNLIKYYKSTVLKVDVITYQQDNSLTVGEIKQISEIRIVSGPFKDRVYTIENYVKSTEAKPMNLKKGDKVMLCAELTENESDIKSIYLYDFYRVNYLLMGIIALTIILVLLGLLKGLKTLLNISIVSLMVVFFIIPLALKGYSLVLLVLPLCLIITALNAVWDLGFSMKTIICITSTAIGLAFAWGAGILSESVAKVVGLGDTELTMLKYMPSAVEVNFSGLLTASILILSLGALIDTNVTLIEKMEQIRLDNPYITMGRLMLQSIASARAYMTRNINTVLLVSVGTILPVWLTYSGYDTPLVQMFNMDAISVILFRFLCCSASLVLIFPVTIFIYAILTKRESIY